MKKYLLILTILPLAFYVSQYLLVDESSERLNLLSLLHDKKFTELNSILMAKHQAIEIDKTKERELYRAIQLFANSDPKHENLIDEWINTQPNSFIPYLVRGTYFGVLGYAYRGGAYANKTKPQRFEKMKLYHQKAYFDFAKAIEIEPSSSLPYAEMISLARDGRAGASREILLVEGLKVMPSSYVVRFAYLSRLQPRWGGSYTEIEQFLEETRPYVKTNPILQDLMGFYEYAKGRDAGSNDKHLESVAYYDAAIKESETSFYLSSRAVAHYRLKQYEFAKKDLDRALELFPDNEYSLVWKGIVLVKLGKNAEAMDSFDLASKLSPFDYRIHNNRANLHSKSGDYKQAIEDYESALFFEPGKVKTRHAMAWLLNYKLENYPRAIEVYEDVLEYETGNPDYWYEYITALNKVHDCKIIPAIEVYLVQCQAGIGRFCSGEYKKWAKDISAFLIQNGTCQHPTEEQF